MAHAEAKFGSECVSLIDSWKQCRGNRGGLLIGDGVVWTQFRTISSGRKRRLRLACSVQCQHCGPNDVRIATGAGLMDLLPAGNFSAGQEKVKIWDMLLCRAPAHALK